MGNPQTADPRKHPQTHLEVSPEQQRNQQECGQRGQGHQREEEGDDGRGAPLRLAVLVRDLGLGAERGVQGAARGGWWRPSARARQMVRPTNAGLQVPQVQHTDGAKLQLQLQLQYCGSPPTHATHR